MWKEFKEFAFKGNVIDLAVGVMIGAAFGKIVSSVVNDIFMPLLSPLTGSLDFSSLFVAMDGNSYATLAKAQEAGSATLNYGAFITTVIDFLIIALCIFLFVRLISKLQRKEAEVPAAQPEARKCPFCQSEISALATRCPHCTSILNEVK